MSSIQRLRSFVPIYRRPLLSRSASSLSDQDDSAGSASLGSSPNRPSRARRCAGWIRRNRSRLCVVLTCLVAVELLTTVIVLTANLIIIDDLQSHLRPISLNNGVSNFLTYLEDQQIPRDDVFTSPSYLNVFLDDEFTRDIIPVPCHSHNDYDRNFPLFDALSAGCTGIEADIWVDPGDDANLLVGHSKSKLRASQTLEDMYIRPLLSILDTMNSPDTSSSSAPAASTPLSGIFTTDPNATTVLMLDFKSLSGDIWTTLQKNLTPLRERGYLQHWNETSQSLTFGPLTIVASGSIDFELIVSSDTNPYRDVFLDAPLLSLTDPDNIANSNSGSLSKCNVSNSYYASSALNPALGVSAFLPNLFTTPEDSVFTSSQLDRLHNQTVIAQELGLKVRYWATPGWPVGTRNAVWSGLVQGVGVDVLNVDDLVGAARWDWEECLGGWVGLC